MASRSRSRDRYRSRTRSPTRSPARRSDYSRSPRYRNASLSSRSRSRSRSRVSRSPSPRRNGRYRDEGRGRSRSRSWSRDRSGRSSRGRSPTPSDSPLRGSTKIVVERLTKNITEEHLREIFGHYGEIRDLDLPMNRQFGTNRGTAYILFARETDAEAAIANMHEAVVDSATIHVSIVLPRRKFSPSPPIARRGANFDPRNPPPPFRHGPPGSAPFPVVPGGVPRRGPLPPMGQSAGPNFGAGAGPGPGPRPGPYGPRSDTYRPQSRSRSRSPPPAGPERRRYRSRSGSYSSRSRSRTPPSRGRGGGGGGGAARAPGYYNDRRRDPSRDSFDSYVRRSRSRSRSRGWRTR